MAPKHTKSKILWTKIVFGHNADARSQKRHWNGVHEIYDGEFVLNFKSCLSNYIITLKLTCFD